MYYKNKKDNERSEEEKKKKRTIPLPEFNYNIKYHNMPTPEGKVKCCFCGEFLDPSKQILVGRTNNEIIYRGVFKSVIDGEEVYACDFEDFNRFKLIRQKQKSGYYG